MLNPATVSQIANAFYRRQYLDSPRVADVAADGVAECAEYRIERGA